MGAAKDHGGLRNKKRKTVKGLAKLFLPKSDQAVQIGDEATQAAHDAKTKE